MELQLLLKYTANLPVTFGSNNWYNHEENDVVAAYSSKILLLYSRMAHLFSRRDLLKTMILYDTVGHSTKLKKVPFFSKRTVHVVIGIDDSKHLPLSKIMSYLPQAQMELQANRLNPINSIIFSLTML